MTSLTHLVILVRVKYGVKNEVMHLSEAIWYFLTSIPLDLLKGSDLSLSTKYQLSFELNQKSSLHES